MLVHKLLVDLAPPFVTAKSWSISDGRTGEILFGKCENDRREIASLTKIMTCFVVVQIIRKIKLNAQKTYLQVSKRNYVNFLNLLRKGQQNLSLEKQLNWAVKAAFSKGRYDSSSKLKEKHFILPLTYFFLQIKRSIF